ncbi:MAG TPA: hypothetical protein VFQ80_11730 [Thermomicrobiales bacterium]|nr:hypothetical protein [Thermomicrobiales bacterium]
MSTLHLHVQEIHSRAHQRDLLAEARRQALLDEAEAGRRRGAGTPALLRGRHAIGAALIRLGERLQAAPLGHERDCAGPFGLPQTPAQ